VKDKIQVLILTVILILNISVLGILLIPEEVQIEERKSIRVEECYGNTYEDNRLIISPDIIVFYRATGEPKQSSDNYSISWSVCHPYDVYWHVLNVTEVNERLK
jgi:hypothetical protein